jgi:O-antigen ligase
LARFVRDAHSLYLQTLGELGLVGLALLVLAFTPGVIATVVRRRKAPPATVAACGAAFAAFAIAAGIDWMWEVTAVSVVGLASLGLLVGKGTSSVPPREVSPRRAGRRLALRIVPVLVVLGVAVAEAVPALVDMRIQSSEAAVSRGDDSAAYEDALAAHAIQPWVSGPYVQLALVDEQRGRLRAARTWIESALDRDPSSWASWLIAARIDTKLGAIPEARVSLRHARELNPRSALFQPG